MSQGCWSAALPCCRDRRGPRTRGRCDSLTPAVLLVLTRDALRAKVQSLWQAGLFQSFDVEFRHAGIVETGASGHAKARIGLRLQKLGDNRLSLLNAAKMGKRSGSVAARGIVRRNLDQDPASQGHSLLEMTCKE